MEKNIVKTFWKGDMVFNATNPGGNLVMGTSKDLGGDDKGLRPKAMMLASLAGCSGIDIAMLINKMKVAITTFDIEVEAELTEKHPKYYHTVKCIYNFYCKWILAWGQLDFYCLGCSKCTILFAFIIVREKQKTYSKS